MTLTLTSEAESTMNAFLGAWLGVPFGELNHSCVWGQCPVPCPASGSTARPEIDIIVSPTA